MKTPVLRKPAGEILAVTFDAGGTLIEPWPSVGSVYAAVAREFDLECTPEQLTRQFNDAWRQRTAFRYTRNEWAELVRHSFAGITDVSNELFDAIYRRFAEPESWLIYDDVIPTLQKLESLGIKLAVISNWDARLGPLLQRLGLATYFDEILISSELNMHKPDQCIFRHAAEKLAVLPGQMLHIGDSLREDVHGARSIGATAFRIRRSGENGADDLESLTAIPLLLGTSIRKSD